VRVYASDEMRLAKRHALVLLGASLALAACASLSGLSGGVSDGGIGDAGHADATVDGGRTRQDAAGADSQRADAGQHDAGGPREATVSADASCTHAAPVSPPAQVSPGGKTVNFVTALLAYTSGVTNSGDGGAVGFDLDQQCTCPGPPSCNSASMATNCDVEPGGHDIVGNALGALFDSQLGGTSEGDLNTRIATGRYNIVLDIEDYNGGANDSDVLVGILTSSGLGNDAGMPSFDGTDVWNIDPESTVGPVEGDAGAFTYTPRYYVSDAYVTNYVLVAHFSQVVVGLSVGTETLNGAILSATIGKTATGLYTLNGQLAARITTASIFGLLGHLDYSDPDGGTHKLCGNDPVFQAAQQSVCAATDIMGLPSQDNTDAGCNALSFAIGFNSIQAVLGPPMATHYPLAGCDGGVVDCP